MIKTNHLNVVKNWNWYIFNNVFFKLFLKKYWGMLSLLALYSLITTLFLTKLDSISLKDPGSEKFVFYILDKNRSFLIFSMLVYLSYIVSLYKSGVFGTLIVNKLNRFNLATFSILGSITPILLFVILNLFMWGVLFGLYGSDFNISVLFNFFSTLSLYIFCSLATTTLLLLFYSLKPIGFKYILVYFLSYTLLNVVLQRVVQNTGYQSWFKYEPLELLLNSNMNSITMFFSLIYSIVFVLFFLFRFKKMHF